MLSILTIFSAIIVAAALIYISYQLVVLRKLSQAEALQKRMDSRINVWLHELDSGSLHSARDKFFEHELYKLDEKFSDIEELTLRERRALEQELYIELVYYQNLHHQLGLGIMEPEQSLPLKYLRCLMHAPQRRHWKDQVRLSNQFPEAFVRHVDSVVKRYDQVEKVMDEDQDAEFESVVQKIFNIPAPPNWLDNT